MNMHQDHQATCLCCINFRFYNDPGYSEWTPGLSIAYTLICHLFDIDIPHLKV